MGTIDSRQGPQSPGVQMSRVQDTPLSRVDDVPSSRQFLDGNYNSIESPLKGQQNGQSHPDSKPSQGPKSRYRKKAIVKQEKDIGNDYFDDMDLDVKPRVTKQ